MDKGIVEGGKDVCNTKDQFTFSNLRAERNDFLFLHYLFLGRLIHTVSKTGKIRKGWLWGREGVVYHDVYSKRRLF